MPETMEGSSSAGRPTRLSVSLVLLLAVSSGAAVGNLYYAQPLLDVMARDLNVDYDAAGLLMTAVQLGYAAGILFIVPLGDVRNRRRLVPLMMLLSALSLAVCAVAPGILLLLGAMIAVGLTTVAGQILIPLAGDLADDANRGRVVGTVVGGALTGIMIARTASGLIAGGLGWRAVFVVAAAIMALLAVVLYRVIPEEPVRAAQGYARLLRSVASLVRQERGLQIVTIYGAINFCTFTLFWTGLTFLLSSPPYNYSPAIIGIIGLLGLVGALVAQGAGRLHDWGWSDRMTGVAWLVAVVAWLVAGLGAPSLVLVLVSIVAVNIAAQGQRVLNQAQLFDIAPGARSRANTAYVAGNFLAGSIGSIVASVLWARGGWVAICAIGMTLSAVGLVLWIGVDVAPRWRARRFTVETTALTPLSPEYRQQQRRRMPCALPTKRKSADSRECTTAERN